MQKCISDFKGYLCPAIRVLVCHVPSRIQPQDAVTLGILIASSATGVIVGVLIQQRRITKPAYAH